MPESDHTHYVLDTHVKPDHVFLQGLLAAFAFEQVYKYEG